MLEIRNIHKTFNPGTINEKIAMNKKLYNENNNLFRFLESKNAEYVGLRDQIAEQEEIIARLSEGKNNAESSRKIKNSMRKM